MLLAALLAWGGDPIAPRAQDAAPQPEAQPLSEEPQLDIVIGLGGMTAWQSACAPIRIDVRGGTRPFDGSLQLRRTGSPARTSYEVPLSAEPGARRRLHLVACDLGSGGSWEWSLDGVTWSSSNVTSAVAPYGPVLAVIGHDIGRLPELEAAFGGSAGAPAQAAGDDFTAVLGPDDVPLEAGGWSQAPFVVLDSRVAPLLMPEAVQALRDHVRSGATLVVAGPELASVPEGLLAATDSGVTQALVPQEDGSDVTLQSWALVPREGSVALPWAGEPRPWMIGRSAGLGRLVTLGLDLRDAGTRAALPATAWLAMAGLTQAAMRPQGVFQPAWVGPVQGVLEREDAQSAVRGGVPPQVAGIHLVLSGIVVIAGGWLLGRRSGGAPRRRDAALLLASLAAVGFLVGAFRSSLAPATTTVIEHDPAEGRARVVTWTIVTHDGVTELPEGTAVPDLIGGFGPSTPPTTLRLGPAPALEMDVLPRVAQVFVRSTRFMSVTPEQLAAVREGAAPLRIEGGTLTGGSSVLGAAPVFLGEIAQAASTGGVTEASVLLEDTGDPSRRVVWIVREDLP